MANGPGAWPKTLARALVGRSYPLSKRLAMVRMARRGAPTVVFSMGKTGSTAIARAVRDATGRPAFQVFRLEPTRLREAEARYRARPVARSSENPFPGAYHLWESDHLVRHPPTPASPWTVITTVREPVAQAVSAYFHALRQSGALGAIDAVDVSIGALTERFVAEAWVRPPGRWFEREFRPALGIDAFAEPFDPTLGYAITETPAVRWLVLRQESFGSAPAVLATFLGLDRPVTVARSNDGASGPFAAIYRQFLDEARIPPTVLDEAYGSEYAQHFYWKGEIAQFRQQWSKA